MQKLLNILKRIIRSILNRRCVCLILGRISGRIGADVKISNLAQVLGWQSVRIGRGTLISDGACINVNNRGQKEQVIIGANVFIGANSFLTTGMGITIGDFALIGRSCSFLNAGHSRDSTRIYSRNGIEEYSKMVIGPNVWLTNNVTIIGGVSVGYGAIIGAGSVVVDDIPPLTLAVGNPARIVKFFDWEGRVWKTVRPESNQREILEEHLRSVPSERKYTESILPAFDKWRLPLKAMGCSRGDLF